MQLNEVREFIDKKDRDLLIDDDPQYGDVWTFCAIDADTKIVPSFRCGKRDHATAKAFVSDVASRMRGRVQISSDALRAYADSIEQVFGADVDFGQIIKTYEHDHSQHPELKYSAPTFVSVDKRAVTGSRDMDLVSTSYIERLNATTAHAPSDPPDAGFQQEVRELRGCGRSALRVLQLCEAAQFAALHSRDGCGNRA